MPTQLQAGAGVLAASFPEKGSDELLDLEPLRSEDMFDWGLPWTKPLYLQVGKGAEEKQFRWGSERAYLGHAKTHGSPM